MARSFRGFPTTSATQVAAWRPDEAKAAARSRVDRLQSALAALGDTESMEARGLQAALKEAERAAKKRPLRDSGRRVSGFHRTFAKPFCTLEEERAKEQQQLDVCDGSHGKVARADGPSIPVVIPASSNVIQLANIPELVSENERLRVTGGGDGGRTRGGSQQVGTSRSGVQAEGECITSNEGSDDGRPVSEVNEDFAPHEELLVEEEVAPVRPSVALMRAGFVQLDSVGFE